MANVSEQDHELLSAYVDGMLTEEERLALEARLHSEPDLLRALTALYLTLAMVKQLPTLTAPRNFTLKDPPARWLMFPTTPAFSALSAAAATFLVVIGFFLLLTSNMRADLAPPQPAITGQSDEVGLTTNQTAGVEEATQESRVAQLPSATAQATREALSTLSQGDVRATATALSLAFGATQVQNYAASSGGAGEGAVITATAVDEIQPDAEAAEGDNAEDSIAMMAPQSTGTPLPTPAQAEIAAASNAAGETTAESAADAATMRNAPPSEAPAGADTFAMQEQQTEAVEMAQEPTIIPSDVPAPTAVANPTATPAPTAVPASAAPRNAIPSILGVGLVLGGALLFGVAYMTAVTRRGNRIRARKEGR